MNEKIEILEPDWLMSFKVWWSIVWRMIVFTIAAIVGLSLLMRIILMFGVNFEEVREIGGFLGWIISLPISLLIVRFILNMEYKNFKVAIIKKRDSQQRGSDTEQHKTESGKQLGG